MECKDARLLLEVAHPLATELPARDVEALAGHLADCPECSTWAESERRSDEQLSTAFQAVAVPKDLSARILRRLNVERDAWYRVRLVRAAGIAAVLLMTIWTGWAIWGSAKPVLDLEDVLGDCDRLISGPAEVEEAFAEEGIVMTAPPDFDYSLFDSHSMVSFHKKQVPLLVFVRHSAKDALRPAVAKVYVLSDRQFNLERLRSRKLLFGSNKNVAIVEHPSNTHVLYVVVYSGTNSLRDFIRGANLKADGWTPC